MGFRKTQPLGFFKQNARYFCLAVGVLLALLLCVNIHFDGSSLTPGKYYICPHYSRRDVVEVDDVNPDSIVIKSNDLQDSIPPEYFVLVHVAGKNYFVEDESGKRLTVQDDMLVMQAPSVADEMCQTWEFRRYQGTALFVITNESSGTSLYANEEEPLSLKQFDDNDKGFGFMPIIEY